MKPNTSSPLLCRVTDLETPFCVCWEDVFRCGDEVTYGWVQVRRLSVVKSRHLVVARIKTHKKWPKLPGKALSDALLMFLGFSWLTPQLKIALRAVFFWTDTVKKSSQLIPDSCQKACVWVCVPPCISLHMHAVPNSIFGCICVWLRKSIYLLEERQNHPIARSRYLCHLIGEESAFLSFLHIKLFDLGVEGTFYNRSTVAHNKFDLIKWPQNLNPQIGIPPSLKTDYVLFAYFQK